MKKSSRSSRSWRSWSSRRSVSRAYSAAVRYSSCSTRRRVIRRRAAKHSSSTVLMSCIEEYMVGGSFSLREDGLLQVVDRRGDDRGVHLEDVLFGHVFEIGD